MKEIKTHEGDHISVKASWSGNNNSVLLARTTREKGRDAWWCLWGPAGSSGEELTQIRCETPGGRPQSHGAASSRFSALVRTAQTTRLTRLNKGENG